VKLEMTEGAVTVGRPFSCGQSWTSRSCSVSRETRDGLVPHSAAMNGLLRLAKDALPASGRKLSSLRE
jgi:hypothetical protein